MSNEAGQPQPRTNIILTAFNRVLKRLRGTDDANVKRIVRRQRMTALLTRRAWLIQLLMFVVGYAWILCVPLAGLSRSTWIDENALQPSQVTTYWDWKDVHVADVYLDDLEQLIARNATSEEKALYIAYQFEKMGIPSSIQSYSISSALGTSVGTNAYGSLSAPRASGSEAIVISASWQSLSMSDADPELRNLNLRGVATVLALANFLKRYSHWAKDLVFVVNDGHLEGMRAFLSAYHGFSQSNLIAEPLTVGSRGVIWTALCIDYPGHSFSHLGLFFEGLDARLPNQDLLNSVGVISRWTAGVPMIIYDHVEPVFYSSAYMFKILPGWLRNLVSDQQQHSMRDYEYRAKNLLRHVGYQAMGRASGVHGLFHQFRIDAVTLYALPADGPHGFHAIGKIIESTLRTANNLLERLHASFFFYLLTGPSMFLAIGKYLPSAVIVGIAMEICGLHGWVGSGWEQVSADSLQEKASGLGIATDGPRWKRRKRPVLEALGVMLGTHAIGLLIFLLATSKYIIGNLNSALFVSFTAIISIVSLSFHFLPFNKSPSVGSASLPSLLRTFTLCIAGTTVCIVSVLNFSLAATMSLLLGPSLVLFTATTTKLGRTLSFFALAALTPIGLMPILGEGAIRIVKRVVWEWDVFGTWFLPFVCLVYIPFVMQAQLAVLLKR